MYDEYMPPAIPSTEAEKAAMTQAYTIPTRPGESSAIIADAAAKTQKEAAATTTTTETVVATTEGTITKKYLIFSIPLSQTPFD